MTDSHATDLTLLLFRLLVAGVFFAHGWNHIFGGGKIAGTAGWFESLGMRPGRLHAWMASVAEIGTGVLLALGLLTPLAAAGMVATMLVALITTHLRNGFFIFLPGQGYEYVLVLGATAMALGALGPGNWSLDHQLDWFQGGWRPLLITVVLGIAAGAAQLVVFWRPDPDRTTAN